MASTESVEGILPNTEPHKASTGVDDRRSAELRDLCALGWLFVAAALVLIILRSPVNSTGDFVYFYSIGRLLNQHPSQDLYNYELQQRIYDELRPDLHGRCGPSPYPPFVALLLRPVASLPFFAAYHVWTVVTLGLYLAGLWLVMGAFLPDRRTYWPALFCGALLFWPFLARTLTSGQIAAIGFFAMSLALSRQQRRQYYISGLALSMCLYKPTLLIWILPLLLIARAWKTLAGFCTGAAVLAFMTTVAFGGASIWYRYARATAYFGSFQPMVDRSHYLDMLAVISLATHRPVSTFVSAICLSIGGAVILFAWRRALTRATEHRTALAWAITLPLMLLVNVYTPIYDSILLIVSLIASARLFRQISQEWLIRGCLVLLAVSFCTSWIADTLRIQVFSFLIAGISALQLWCLKQTKAVALETVRV